MELLFLSTRLSSESEQVQHDNIKYLGSEMTCCIIERLRFDVLYAIVVLEWP
jgi:hypothetical protein